MSMPLHEIKKYDLDIKNATTRIVNQLQAPYSISKDTIASLLLQDDQEIFELVKSKESSQRVLEISKIVNDLKNSLDCPIHYILAIQKNIESDKLLRDVIKTSEEKNHHISDFINKLTINPFSGFIILALVVYFGLYKFVGEFGAGTLVDLIEDKLFTAHINPFFNWLIGTYIPWKPIQDLLANDYGILTMGVRYAVAIVLPIVTVFFFVFAIIEDSGYLPRLALLVDFIFKKIGLNGRAVIPMTLGFGCDTMATMVSRTLETKREQIIATFLLALAIPCSAQLGVILAVLSGHPAALAVWIGFMALIFLFIGYLTSKLLPGSKPSFYMELPPLRLPSIGNVIVKTYSRMYWYFKEIFPLFILASILIWIGNITGIFSMLLSIISPVIQAIGLPSEMSSVFLFGFFRRDYGAAGLFDLQQSGLLNGIQLVVAASTLTLFVPCIAQFMMMVKERGLKTALYMAAFIFPFAFLCGYFLNKILLLSGVSL